MMILGKSTLNMNLPHPDPHSRLVGPPQTSPLRIHLRSCRLPDNLSQLSPKVWDPNTHPYPRSRSHPQRPFPPFLTPAPHSSSSALQRPRGLVFLVMLVLHPCGERGLEELWDHRTPEREMSEMKYHSTKILKSSRF